LIEQGNLLFASIVEIIEPSPERIEPPCPYFGRCGGCDFQQLTYEAQLKAKAEIIRDCLHRIAHVELPQVSVVPSPTHWHYRARATWQLDPDQQTLGYYERSSRRVCDVVECAVLVPPLQKTLENLRSNQFQNIPADLKHLDVVYGDGGVSLAPSFDHIGPIARTVSDAAVILRAIAGYDSKDKVSVDHPVDDYVGALNQKLEPLTIGIPRKFFFADLHPEVASAIEHAIKVLAGFSREVRDLEFEVPTQRTLQGAESYTYHAENIKRSPDLYQPETLRRIKNGGSVEPAEVERRLKLLAKFRAEVGKIFAEVDVLVTPTVPIPPPTIAELKQNPDQLRERELILLRNTRPFNVWGLPAISVPCGFTESGLPIGLQIAGPHWQETKVLQLAQAYEKATVWHKRQPSTSQN